MRSSTCEKDKDLKPKLTVAQVVAWRIVKHLEDHRRIITSDMENFILEQTASIAEAVRDELLTIAAGRADYWRDRVGDDLFGKESQIRLEEATYLSEMMGRDSWT